MLLVAGLAVLAIGLAIRFADLRFQIVLSNSMQPTFSAGDVVVTTPVPVSALNVGDVIAFYPPGNSTPVMHRISSLENGVITTRGDANSTVDPWRLQLSQPTANRLVAVIPYLGFLAQFGRPALLIAGVLVGIWIVREIAREVRRWATRRQH